jgi:uncharacterized protein YqjF (DUF2071 family)
MPGDFDRSILDAVAHRPWPLPAGAWVMTQSWHDLLFAHWPVEPARLEPFLPAGLTLDLFDDRAWVGVVPFRMTNVTPRGSPNLPGVSAFPELNVRTYVRPLDPGGPYAGRAFRPGGPEGPPQARRPGVYFFSLDATSRLAVLTARALYHLPYFPAAMRLDARDGVIHYTSRRASGAGQAAELVARYQPIGPAFAPQPGSLEYFLTERYCLYAADRRGRIVTADIHHRPWPLRPAEAEIRVNTMAGAAGIVLPETPPLLHFAARQDVVVWWPRRVR